MTFKDMTIFNLIKKIIRGNYSYYYHLLPVKKNKIVISSFSGNGYGGNGKYIVEKIIEEDLAFDIVWLLRKELYSKANFPSKVRIVRYNSLKALYELATAKIWIDNTRKFFYPPKKKNQYYIQTWHASLGVKKLERDTEETLSPAYVKIAKTDASITDLMLAGSDFRYNLYKKSFWYSGEVLKSGLPRSDLFFKDSLDVRDKVYDYFNIEKEKKIVLFAPSFRDSKNNNVYKLEFENILNTLKDKFGGQWLFLVRFHPKVASLNEIIEYSDYVKDATMYDDMQELLISSHILITDYSSVMFDFSLTNRICLLHMEDLDDYIKKERELYFDLKSLPFESSTSHVELTKNILEFDNDKYLKKLGEFKSTIGDYEDGNATNRVLRRIKEVILETN